MPMARREILGRTYGRLTPVELVRVHGHRHYWRCVCACGREHVAEGRRLARTETVECLSCAQLRHAHGTAPERGELALYRVEIDRQAKKAQRTAQRLLRRRRRICVAS